jgi:hypothetical protein
MEDVPQEYREAARVAITGVMQPQPIRQIAPINSRARTRSSANSCWPLRGVDGLTFAERKAKEKERG